jgi:hypothetical protein
MPRAQAAENASGDIADDRRSRIVQRQVTCWTASIALSALIAKRVVYHQQVVALMMLDDRSFANHTRLAVLGNLVLREIDPLDPLALSGAAFSGLYRPGVREDRNSRRQKDAVFGSHASRTAIQ